MVVTYKHLLVYAPPSWALFELRVEGLNWKTNQWTFGSFRVSDGDVRSQMQAMDEFLKLLLRMPIARVYMEDEIGFERERSWLEYAMHRLNDVPRRISNGPRHDQLRKWGYWSEVPRERDAIGLAITAVREWKEEKT